MDVRCRLLPTVVRMYSNKVFSGDLHISWLIAEKQLKSVVPTCKVREGYHTQPAGPEYSAHLTQGVFKVRQAVQYPKTHDEGEVAARIGPGGIQ